MSLIGSLIFHIHHRAQISTGGLGHQVDIVAIFRVVPRRIQDHFINQLNGAGFGVDHLHQWRQRVFNACEPNDGQARARGLGNNFQRGLHHHGKSAFGTTQQLRQIQLVKSARRAGLKLLQQNVNVVAVDMAHYFWNAFLNLSGKRQNERGQSTRDCILRRVAIA